MEREALECRACGETFDHDQADGRMTFAGSTEEPAEYDLRCPSCGSTRVDVTYIECRPVRGNE